MDPSVGKEGHRLATMALPWKQTILLGLGFFGISLLWPIYDSFVPIFLHAFGLSNRTIGFLMTLDNYVSLLVQPWVGQRSDRTRTSFGRRFPYVIIGAPVAAAGASLIPLAAGHSLPQLVLAMLLTTLALAFFRTPVVALLGDIYPPALRSRANGIINFMGLLGGILALVVGGRWYRIHHAYPFWGAAGGMLLVLALLLALVREPARSEREEKSPTLLELLGSLRSGSQRGVLFLLSALLAWSIGLTALQAFFTLFARAELGLNAGTTAQLQSLYPIAGLIFAIPGGYLGSHLGRRRLLLLCLALALLILLTFLLLPARAFQGVGTVELMDPGTWWGSPGFRALILLLLGAGATLTIVTVNVLPLLLDLAPAGQSGSYTGLYYLFGSLASIVGPPLAGSLVDATGSYRSLFLFAPGWLMLGLLLLWQVREEGEWDRESAHAGEER